MKKSLFSCLAVLFLILALSAPASGNLEGTLEYQYTNDQLSYCVKGSYWFNDRWAISGGYCLQDRSLSAALLYKTDPVFNGTNSYIGLGVRDLNDSYNSGLLLAQKLELTFGTKLALKVIPGLSLSLEARMIPNELFNRDQSGAGFKPVVGMAINYQLPGSRASGADTAAASESDAYLLAKLITAEAGDELYDGQVAVAAVVLNRTKSGEFPTTIREVIYQPGQFSSLPKLPATTPAPSCINAARDALNGVDPSRGALYFYNPATCSAEGLEFFNTANLTVTARIGNHLFLR